MTEQQNEVIMEELLTVNEVAAVLRMTPKGIYSLVSNKKIPYFKVSNRVRFKRDEIMTWLDSQRVPVQAATLDA